MNTKFNNIRYTPLKSLQSSAQKPNSSNLVRFGQSKSKLETNPKPEKLTWTEVVTYVLGTIGTLFSQVFAFIFLPLEMLFNFLKNKKKR
jgi:hypothetical protein